MRLLATVGLILSVLVLCGAFIGGCLDAFMMPDQRQAAGRYLARAHDIASILWLREDGSFDENAECNGIVYHAEGNWEILKTSDGAYLVRTGGVVMPENGVIGIVVQSNAKSVMSVTPMYKLPGCSTRVLFRVGDNLQYVKQ
jgi:hypothetical protein